MKSFKIIFITAILILIFQVQFSCQKFYSYEGGVASKGSVLLKGSTNNCVATSYGTYTAGTILDSNNYIIDSVHVTLAGTYTITTDTLNGIGFKASGRFTDTGSFPVKLYGFGTPVTTGTYNYSLTYNSSNCAVSVTTN